MKKNYQKPGMEIEMLQTHEMLAMSYGLATDETGGNLSREFDDYDFEDEGSLY